MYLIRVKEPFDAAHFLPWHEGKCKNLHGHRWEVEVVISARELDEHGFVVDFALVKDIIKRVIPDHQPLNIGQFMFELFHLFPDYKTGLTTIANVLGNWCVDPTAERIAKKLFTLIKSEIDIEGIDASLVEVTVWESPKCSVTYKPDEEE